MESTEENKKLYELSYLVRDEAGATEVASVLKKQGADMKNEAPLRQVALAYQIKKESNAYLGTVQFEMGSAAAKALEFDLTTAPGVLRFLLVKPPVVKERTSKKGKSAPRAAAPIQPVERKPASPVLSNEALEKKIEEILQ